LHQVVPLRLQGFRQLFGQRKMGVTGIWPPWLARPAAGEIFLGKALSNHTNLRKIWLKQQFLNPPKKPFSPPLFSLSLSFSRNAHEMMKL